jgi:hypothetical protein
VRATRYTRVWLFRWVNQDGDDLSSHVNPVRTRLRLYQTSWENPKPDLEVVSFDFVSAMANSAPFLIAVTVE